MAEPGDKPTILVVDDSPDNITILVELLRSDYRVKTARSGVKALELAAAHPLDLVLLDVVMPEMDGYEVCRQLKASRATEGVPVIFVTAMNEVGDEARGFELGAVDYITKPFSPPIVRARIESCLTLQRARLEAQAANRFKSEFLASISHELRTPLSSIIGYTELMQEDAEEDGNAQVATDLQRIHGAAHLLLDLINDLLDFSKIEAGRLELHFEETALGPLFEEVLQTTKPMMDKNGNQLVLDLPSPLPIPEVDVVRVRQVLFNLLSNAAKFTQDGTVTVSLSEQPGLLVIRVTDTGVGMSEEQLKRIFRPYVQAEAATTRRFGGTGLGLSISKSLCEMMHGELLVESTPGAGSTFTVRLPRVPPR